MQPLAITKEVFIPKSTDGFNETEAFNQLISLGNKYSENDYQLSYKIHSDAGDRIIIDVNDLTNLNGNPTEFSELKTIDLSKYPSIKSLYIGSLSRVIIIIPRAYGIVRKAVSCAASCYASVDSTPSNPDICKFLFQFEITPDVDPVDFIMLLKETQSNSELQTYKLKFADNISAKAVSTLFSAFSINPSFDSSVTPNNFYVTATIVDAPNQSAVVNGNLFIQQLCRAPQGCVLGTISLELDDNFPNPVPTPVTLSLPKAISNDGISWFIDSDTQTLKLTNSTSFNFLIERYVLCSDQEIGDPVNANLPIASGESTSISLPENFDNLSIVLAYMESSELVDRTNISKYMDIKAQDAQNVQYFTGVSGSQIDYVKYGINHIDVQIFLDSASSMTVPPLLLAANHTADDTHIMLPLQFAVTSLPATVQFSINFTGTSKSAVSFTKPNDFIKSPILDLTDADVSALVNG